MIEIKIPKAPNIAILLTNYLNQTGYIGNIYNLLFDKTDEKFFDFGDFVKSDKVFSILCKLVEENFEYTIIDNKNDILNTRFLEETIEDKECNNLLDIQNQFKGFKMECKNGEHSIAAIQHEYMLYWYNLMNIRILYLRVQDGKKEYQKALNYSMFRLYNVFSNSTSIKEFLHHLFNEYYNGYILKNDMLINLFLSYTRLYILLDKNRANNIPIYKISVNDFYDTLFNVDNLYEEKNKHTVIDAFRALIDYCNHKFHDSINSNDETELYLSHAKISGYVKLIRRLESLFPFLSENIILSYYIQFFEELSCDCFTFNLNDIRLLLTPLYSHWLLNVFTLYPDNCNIQSLSELRKERIFLSNQVISFLNEKEINIDNRDILMKEVDILFSHVDYRVALPISYLAGISYSCMRSQSFDKESFESEFNKHGVFSDEIYERYKNLDMYNYKELDSEELSSIQNTHISLVNDEIKTLIFSSQLEWRSLDERMNNYAKYEVLYPYNSSVMHDIAIFLDENKMHNDALSIIIKAIILDFNNLLLWQSFSIILSNLSYKEDSHIASFIARLES
ncbi:hypothetical protein [Spirosoma jeollabukense]